MRASAQGACVQCEHLSGGHHKKKSSTKGKGKGCCNRPFHVGCAVYLGSCASFSVSVSCYACLGGLNALFHDLATLIHT